MMCKKCLVSAWFIIPIPRVLTVSLNPSQVASPFCLDPVAAEELAVFTSFFLTKTDLVWFGGQR